MEANNQRLSHPSAVQNFVRCSGSSVYLTRETVVEHLSETGMTCGNICCSTASVQDSLERKFGKDGGKIPIEPSEAFKTRIAVSTRFCRHELSWEVFSVLFVMHTSG